MLLRLIGTVASDHLIKLNNIRQEKIQKQHPHSRRYRQKPWIGLIVFSDNNGPSVKLCLDSIVANKYKKMKVIIVDNASTDGTRKIVKSYLKSTGTVDISLYARRKRVDRDIAIKSAICRLSTDIMWIINDTDLLPPTALKDVAYEFNMAKPTGLVCSRTIVSQSSLIGFYAQYDNLLREQAIQQLTLLRQYDKADIFKTTTERQKILYTDRVEIIEGASVNYASWVSSLKNWQINMLNLQRGRYGTVIRIVWATGVLLQPLALTYSFYLLLKLQVSSFYLVALLLISLLFLIAIWNSKLSYAQKIITSVCMPALCLGYYLTSGISMLLLITTFFKKIRSISIRPISIWLTAR